MTDRPPPSFGTYRPTRDPDAEPPRTGPAAQPPRTSQAQPPRTSQSQPPRVDPTARPATLPPPPPRTGRAFDPSRTLDPDYVPDPGALPRVATQRIRPPARPPLPDFDDEPRGRLLVRLLAGLGVAVAAAVLAAYLLVPKDLVRERLSAEVRARTGRDLTIAGGTSLSLWPRPAIVVHAVTLSSPPAMGGEPLLRADEIEIAVGLLPLLVRDISVDRLVLKHPVFDLRIDAAGHKNWEFAAAAPLVRYADAGAAQSKAMPQELKDFIKGSSDTSVAAASRSGARFGDLSLGNVRIVDGRGHYHDERGGIDETVSALDAQVTLENMARPLDVTADGVWRGKKVHSVSAISPVRALIEGRAVQVDSKVTADPVTASFVGTLTPAGAGSSPEADGQLRIDAASLDALSRWLGTPPLGDLAGKATIDGKVHYSATGLSLTETHVGLGPLAGTATLGVEMRSPRPLVKGTIRFSTLDLGAAPALAASLARTPPMSTQPAPTPAAITAVAPPAAVPPSAPTSIDDLLRSAPSPLAPKPEVRGYLARDGWSDEPIDLASLATADADVRVSFDRLVWQTLSTGGGQATLTLKDKAARLTLDDVQLYGGRARGFVSLDGRGTEATIGGNLTADGVDALPFLQAIGGFDWIAGRARTSVAIAARGTTERQLIGTLNGKADLAVADGALLGLDMASVARNLAQGKPAAFERTAGAKTDFSAFSASVQIASGIARNTDLKLTSQDLTATGAGTIDLPQRTMSYLLKPKLASLGGIEVPLKIEGSLDKPVVTPQMAGAIDSAAKAIDTFAKTPQGQEVQETVKGLLNGDPAAQAKAKTFLDQLFKK